MKLHTWLRGGTGARYSFSVFFFLQPICQGHCAVFGNTIFKWIGGKNSQLTRSILSSLWDALSSIAKENEWTIEENTPLFVVAIFWAQINPINQSNQSIMGVFFLIRFSVLLVLPLCTLDMVIPVLEALTFRILHTDATALLFLLSPFSGNPITNKETNPLHTPKDR